MQLGSVFRVWARLWGGWNRERGTGWSAGWLGGGALVVEFEEAGQDFIAGQVGGPAVGGKDGFIEGAVGVVEPGALALFAQVIEVGEGAVLQFLGIDLGRIEPGIAEAEEFAGGVGDGLDAGIVFFGRLGSRRPAVDGEGARSRCNGRWRRWLTRIHFGKLGEKWK